MRTLVATAVAALVAAACSPRSGPAPSTGRRAAEGKAQALAASPDGAWLSWLADCTVGEPGGRRGGCALRVVSSGGGTPVPVAEGVEPSPGSFAWGADGTLVALAARDPRTGAGDLMAWRPASGRRRVAAGVVAFRLGADGTLAFSSGAGLFLAPSGGEPGRIAGEGSCLEFALAPPPGRALAARVRAEGGATALLLWRSPSSRPEPVARDVGAFSFSSDGAWLAAVAGIAPGREGNLVVVGVDGPTRTAASAVGPFQWAPRAPRLAWLEGFDPRGNAGRLATAEPGGKVVLHGEPVTGFELAPGGSEVAYERHSVKGGYSATLELSPAGAAAPRVVARDAAGFAFSPDGSWLLYRGGCGPSGDRCSLFRVATGSVHREPERIADDVVAFTPLPGSSDRILLSVARRDGAGVDLSAWIGGRVVPLGARVRPGSAISLSPAGSRAAWIETAPGREGVYVADVP